MIVQRLLKARWLGMSRDQNSWCAKKSTHSRYPISSYAFPAFMYRSSGRKIAHVFTDTHSHHFTSRHTFNKRVNFFALANNNLLHKQAMTSSGSHRFIVVPHVAVIWQHYTTACFSSKNTGLSGKTKRGSSTLTQTGRETFCSLASWSTKITN